MSHQEYNLIPGEDDEEIDDDEPMDQMDENSIKSDDESGEKQDTSSVGSSSPTLTPTPEPPELNGKSHHPKHPAPQFLIEDYMPPAKTSSHDLSHTYSWDSQLADPSFAASPVSAFQHAPMADCWDNIIVGMKVEVENKDTDPIPGVFTTAYWVATVLRIQGYEVMLRYEGFGQDAGKDFWMNLCSDKVHPVGWCATKGKPLIPPKTIQTRYTDWKEFLVKRLTGARTLPTNFYNKVWESVGSMFKAGMSLEVVDKMRISQVRVATVVDITGRRLQLSYSGNSEDGFWCHEESPLINPVGWARRVGHQIEASQQYHDKCAMETYLDTDCTPDMFPEYRQPSGTFLAGMKMEAVDPLNLATICVATVMKVLRFGYVMIRIDGYETDPTGGDWFCYHSSSPLIFPPGFCERNHIKLKVPAGYDGVFSWVDYLKINKAQAAPINLFSHKDNCKHGFKAGMKLESTDLMDPRLICVGTISRVVGRLLRVHFDGWEEDFDQWMDCESVDIYPVGWAELVGHRLEGPRMKIQPKEKKEKKKVNPAKKKKTTKSTTNKRKHESTASSVGDMDEDQSFSPTPPFDEEPATIVKPDNMDTAPEATNITNSQEHTVTDTINNQKEAVTETMDAAEIVTDTKPAVTEQEKDEIQEEPIVPDQPPKYIPRLVDAAGNSTPHRKDSNLEPSVWTVADVAEFLKINECAKLADAFFEKGVDGNTFLTMGKTEIMATVNNKMGPCLKVENLLSLLKNRLNPAQARLLASIRKN